MNAQYQPAKKLKYSLFPKCISQSVNSCYECGGVGVGVEGGEQSRLAKQLRFYPEDFSDFNNSDFSRRGHTELLTQIGFGGRLCPGNVLT